MALLDFALGVRDLGLEDARGSGVEAAELVGFLEGEHGVGEVFVGCAGHLIFGDGGGVGVVCAG